MAVEGSGRMHGGLQDISHEGVPQHELQLAMDIDMTEGQSPTVIIPNSTASSGESLGFDDGPDVNSPLENIPSTTRSPANSTDFASSTESFSSTSTEVNSNKRQRSDSYDGLNDQDRFINVVNEQFDLEILLKHRELETIEQELGKTQACLEQLRRCSLLPYASSEDILNGTGAQLRPANGGPTPQWAPAWGVVDGPYTRHYSQWLLPDQRFDGDGNIVNVVEPESQPTSTRPQRASVLRAQQTKGFMEQGCYYQKKDGSVVKMQCVDCKRGDFNSAQGFINHCRISHQRDYASHEAAAEECGQALTESELQAYLAHRASKASAVAGLAPSTRQSTSASTNNTPVRDRKRSTKGKNTILPPKISKGTSDHPLTPPTDPVETLSSPSRPQVAHLKSLLLKKQIAVDEIDSMVEDAVSSPVAGGHDDDDDDDSEPEQTVTRAGRTVKPVTHGPRDSSDRQGKDANGPQKPPSTIIKLKISTPLRMPSAPKKEEMENSIIFQTTPSVPHPNTSGKDLSLLTRNSPQMLVWDPTMTATPAKEAIIPKSKSQTQPRRLLPKLPTSTTPATPHQQLTQMQSSAAEFQLSSNADHGVQDPARRQRLESDASSAIPPHFDPQNNSF